MTGLRDIDCVRIGRRLCVAALVVGLSALGALAEPPAPPPAAASAGDGGHSPPPAVKGSERDAAEHADQPPRDAAPRHGANRNGEADRVEHAAHPAPNGGKKAGPAGSLNRDTELVPPVRRAPPISARDRLFKLIHAAKPTQPAQATRLHPASTGVGAPSVPRRNAIGIAIDAGTAAPAVGAPHWGQRPDQPANGTTRTAATVAVPNAWHPPIPVPAAPTSGGLNGTTLVRVGSGPAILGGPARATTGINGTTVRPKR